MTGKELFLSMNELEDGLAEELFLPRQGRRQPWIVAVALAACAALVLFGALALNRTAPPRESLPPSTVQHAETVFVPRETGAPPVEASIEPPETVPPLVVSLSEIAVNPLAPLADAARAWYDPE